MPKVKFVDALPPRTGGHPSKYDGVVRTLKANPNRWAEVASVQKNTVKMYTVTFLRKQGLQVSVRKAENGWTKIYARYNTTATTKKVKARKKK